MQLPLHLVFVFFLTVVALSESEGEHVQKKKSYTGYKVIRTEKLANQHLAETIFEKFNGVAPNDVQVWSHAKVGRETDILVSPAQYDAVQGYLEGLGVKYQVTIPDLEEVLKAEEAVVSPAPSSGSRQSSSGRLTHTSYARYADIVQFAKTISENERSGLQIDYQSIGKSYEGREIIAVKMSTGGNGAKPAIFLDGGMHAREWISVATTTYIMDIFAKNGTRTNDLLKMFDWFFVPVINVDGYEYSHTTERMWRKTRSANPGYSCKGTDPNRNYSYKFGGQGTSSNPCSETYKGRAAFSEVETKAHSDYILANRNQIKMYISFHAYGQYCLVPWGYADEKPADYNELYNVGLRGVEALEATYGAQYDIGTCPELLYPAAGGSDDWAKGGAGVKYSYTLELRDTGRSGFILPASQIKPTGEETFNAVKAMAYAVYQNLVG